MDRVQRKELENRHSRQKQTVHFFSFLWVEQKDLLRSHRVMLKCICMCACVCVHAHVRSRARAGSTTPTAHNTRSSPESPSRLLQDQGSVTTDHDSVGDLLGAPDKLWPPPPEPSNSSVSSKHFLHREASSNALNKYGPPIGANSSLYPSFTGLFQFVFRVSVLLCSLSLYTTQM